MFKLIKRDFYSRVVHCFQRYLNYSLNSVLFYWSHSYSSQYLTDDMLIDRLWKSTFIFWFCNKVKCWRRVDGEGLFTKKDNERGWQL